MPGHRQEEGGPPPAQGLEEDGVGVLKAQEGEGQGHGPQGPDSHSNHIGIPAEGGDERRSGHHQEEGDRGTENGRPAQGVAKGTSDPGQVAGTVGESRQGLEALAETEEDHHGEAVNPQSYSDGGDGAVFEGGRRIGHQRHGHAGEALPEEGWDSDGHDLAVDIETGGDVPHLQPDYPGFTQVEAQQEEGADSLARDGGRRRPGQPHVEDKHEERVEEDVQNRPEAYGHAADPSGSFGPEHIIHAHVDHLKSGAADDDGTVNQRLLHDGGCGSEEGQQRFNVRQAQKHRGEGHRHGGEEGGGGNGGSLIPLALSQLYGNHRRGSHAEGQPHRTDEHVYGKKHRRGAQGGGIPQKADEQGIHDIVDGADEHGDYGGDAQAHERLGYGGFSQKCGAFIIHCCCSP